MDCTAVDGHDVAGGVAELDGSTENILHRAAADGHRVPLSAAVGAACTAFCTAAIDSLLHGAAVDDHMVLLGDAATVGVSAVNLILQDAAFDGHRVPLSAAAIIYIASRNPLLHSAAVDGHCIFLGAAAAAAAAIAAVDSRHRAAGDGHVVVGGRAARGGAAVDCILHRAAFDEHLVVRDAALAVCIASENLPLRRAVFDGHDVAGDCPRVVGVPDVSSIDISVYRRSSTFDGHAVAGGRTIDIAQAQVSSIHALVYRAAVDHHRIATGISAKVGASAVGIAAVSRMVEKPASVLDDEMIPCHTAALIVAAVRNPCIGHAVHGQLLSREGSGGVREAAGGAGAVPCIRHGVSRVRRRIPRVYGIVICRLRTGGAAPETPSEGQCHRDC